MSSDRAWERFAGAFSIGILVVYSLLAASVSLVDTHRERHIFPVSLMPMYRSTPIITPASQKRIDAARGGERQ